MVAFDVVEYILLRSDVADILRSKSVCKLWYNQISSSVPSFVNKTHLEFVCNKEENQTRKIDMITSYLDTSGRRSQVPLEWRAYARWSVQGSCNGLVCLHSVGVSVYGRMFVINPATREVRDTGYPERESKEMRCHGFGYDSSSDDYKVVMASSYRPEVQIFSLKSGNWKFWGSEEKVIPVEKKKKKKEIPDEKNKKEKEIPDGKKEKKINYWFDDGRLINPGILFNGALHWFWFRVDDDGNRSKDISLVSFDLAKEEFNDISQPNDTGYVWSYSYTLGVIEGRLCIFPYGEEDKSFPIWVMGNDNSWELLEEPMKDHAIHCMLNTGGHKVLPPYICDENILLSRSQEHIPSPMFVQTLVSPIVKTNRSYPIAGNVEENGVHSVEDEEHIPSPMFVQTLVSPIAGNVVENSDKEEKKENATSSMEEID